MTRFINVRSAPSSAGRKARLGLESLEAREVPAGLNPRSVVPDFAGNTMAAARVVTLPDMQQQAFTDYLPSASDLDFYRVDLRQGEFVAANVVGTGSAALAGSLQVLDSSGAMVAQWRAGTIQGALHGNPATGFYADHDGSYYIRVATTGASAGAARRYELDLERVALQETGTNAQLAQSGAYHAWLNKAGDTLYVTGPSGYGFSLRGNWAQTVSNGNVAYTATGTLYLKTAALGSVGEIALQVASGQNFKVSTHTSGQVQLGELTGVTGKFGLSLAPVAGVIKSTFGLDVSNQSVLGGWTIKTGAQIKQQYQSYVQRDIAQLLDGVPYLVYGDAGTMNVHFGSVSLTTTDQAKTVLIADPADPFLYVAYKNYAAAGSVHGRIPFKPDVALPSSSGSSSIGSIPSHQTGFYGEVYAAGLFPVSGLPMTINGDVTVDLDANGDGQYLGGAGNASQLFHGDLGAIENVLKDINVGVNGGVNLGYTVAGVNVSVPLGQASAFYNGPQQQISFAGKQGTAMNPWAGTVLSNFQAGPGTAIEGFVKRDGHFSVATTSNYRLFNMNAAMTLTVTDHDITAEGKLTTPIATADVTGNIGFNGNFTWTGTTHVGIGGGNTFIRGDSDFVLTKTSAGMTFDVNLDCQARLSISGFKAEGDVTGHLKVRVNNQGQVVYDVGSLKFSGGVYVYNPITHKWNKIGSATVSVALNGKKLSFHACGHGFAINLP